METLQETQHFNEEEMKKAIRNLDLGVEEKDLELTKISLEGMEQLLEDNFANIFKLNSEWYSAKESNPDSPSTDGKYFCALRVNMDPKLNHEKLNTLLRKYINLKLKKTPSYFRTVQDDQIIDYFIYPSEIRQDLNNLLSELND